MTWSMRARLTGLLAAAVAAVLLATLGAVRYATAEPGVEQLARMIESEVLLAERVLAGGDDAAPVAVARSGIAVADVAPAAITEAQLKFTGDLLARLGQRFGAERVRLGGRPSLRIWVRAEAGARPWLGVEIEPFLSRMRRAFWVILLSSAAVVLLAAGWFARRITRPLERLAAAAPRLVAGEAVAPETGALPPELDALARALERAARDRHLALAAREQALAEVSHDLRTPLARLRFALELGDAEVPARRAAMVADVEELDAIVGQALAWLRDGRDEPAEDLDLAALLEGVVAAFARQHEGIAMEAATARGASARISGKPVALKRALSNLLDNAVRHGQAPVWVGLAREGDTVRIVVRDAGPSGDRADGAAHYGMGLAIVRAVAAAHRGSIAVATGAAGHQVTLTLRDV